MNDVVKTGRVSREMLESREYGDTFLPFDYFVELLQEQQKIDAELEDPDPVNAQSIIDMLLGETPTDTDQASFDMVNAVIKMCRNNPHLLAKYKYVNYDTLSGFVLSIRLDGAPSGVVSTKHGVVNYSIPDQIQDHILVFRVGDFQSPSFSGTDFRWCNMYHEIMTQDELASVSSIKDWDNLIGRFGPRSADHWLDRSQLKLQIGSGINYDASSKLKRKSGRYFELILDTLSKIPNGADVSKLIKNEMDSRGH